jgi:transcriptional regulator with XRE-family HTH domain
MSAAGCASPHAARHEPEKLGERLGLTFQQVQKYEKGINRIGASRLLDLRALGVRVQFFYEEALTDELQPVNHGFAEKPAENSTSSSCAAATAWS